MCKAEYFKNSWVWRLVTCPEERCLILGPRVCSHCSPEMEKSLGTCGSTNISGVPTSSYQLEHGQVAFLSPERSPSCGRQSFPPALLLTELSLLSTASPLLCFLLLFAFSVFLFSYCASIFLVLSNAITYSKKLGHYQPSFSA